MTQGACIVTRRVTTQVQRGTSRVYFSKETNTWRLEQDDGTELEYDAAKGAWLPVVRLLLKDTPESGTNITYYPGR